MKRYDVHVHMFKKEQNPEGLLARLDRAEIYGAGIFSCPPQEYDEGGLKSVERLELLLHLTAAAPDRLIPILWVHPEEPDVLDLVKEAAGRGVRGFKIICNNFHVYEDKSMELLHAIADLGKPAMFHSGILWDQTPSSQFNRPLDFESLIEVPRLRFSLAHCSWPWYDECLALYGKFLTVGQREDSKGTEMFFDLTPGTPAIYRRDLLTKLLTVGYDTTRNILFGTDCSAENYADAWTREWTDRDNGIYREIGVGEETLEYIYEKNARRFFGLVEEKVEHRRLSIDGQ